MAFSTSDIAAMADLRRQGHSFREIASLVGSNESTVAQYVGRIQPANPSSQARRGIRARQVTEDLVMRALATTGRIDSPGPLLSAVGRDDNAVRDALASLHERGLVAYTLKPWGQTIRMVDIALTAEGHRNIPEPIRHAQSGTTGTHTLEGRTGDTSDYRTLPHHTTGGEIVRTFEPVLGQWPELDALRARVAAVPKLRAAATALPVGDGVREVIERRIQDLEDMPALEREYLRYAETYRRANKPGA